MEVKAKVLLRNNHMLKAREKLYLTQKDLAELALVPLAFVSNLENFDYTYQTKDLQNWVDRIATVLELSRKKVMPEEVQGKVFQSKFEFVKEIEVQQLPNLQKQLLLEAPTSIPPEVEANVDKEALEKLLEKAYVFLSPRELEVVKLRFGLAGESSHTFDQVGKILSVSRERIRQVEARALRKLRVRSRSIKDPQLRPLVDLR